jgi:hypothetical protein
MAKLSSRNLSLEIRYKEFDDQDWIQYEIFFLYKDQPMIQDAQLKRVNEHWQNRSAGAFKANENERDRMIDMIQKALDTDEPQYYSPTDPDIILAIYPKMIFPFMPSNLELVWASDESIQQAEDHELIREVAGGRLPDDFFTLILMVDIYNYGEEHGYYGEGPALIMMPRRHELRTFLDELQTEYAEFCKTWNIPDQQEGGMQGADDAK